MRLNGRAHRPEAPAPDRLDGVCQSPEGRRIFPRMTVQENLEMGAFARRDGDAARKAGPGARADIVSDACGAPEAERRHASGGEQQMLAIGRR